MTRDAYTDRLLDLAYGELPDREAREVEAHAASCEACRGELARIRGTRRIMAALPEEPAPERGERILLAAAREAAEARRPRRLVPRWLLGGVAVAASVVVVAVVSYRVAELSPRRDEQTALLGESRYASPPPAAAPAPPPAAVAEEGAGQATDVEREASRARPAEPKRVAQAPRPGSLAAQEPQAGAGAARYGARTAAPPPPPPPAAASRVAAAPPPPARAEAPEAAAPPAPLAAAPAPAAPPPPAGGIAAAERAAAPAMRKSAAAPEARAGYAPGVAAEADAAAAGGPRAATRAFPGCEGESARRVETDARGQVVRYVREGWIDGRRLRVVHAFGPDGRPAGVSVTDLDRPGAALDARALGLSLPERAEDAGIDAPPRCGR